MPVLLELMSLPPITNRVFAPRALTPVPLSTNALLNATMFAIWLIPEPELAAPQSEASINVLAFGPNAPTDPPHVLSAMTLLRSVMIDAVPAALPGPSNTPMPLLWMWLSTTTVLVAAAVV